MTIDSDDEKRTQKPNGKPKNEEEEHRLDPDFRFDLSEDPYVELLRSDHLEDVVKKIAKLVCILSIVPSLSCRATCRIQCP
jgi:ATP-dependent RNA helicase DDX27